MGQVCIAVRDTHDIDKKNPLDFYAVKAQIKSALWEHRRTHSRGIRAEHHQLFYGRDVGYVVERLTLDEATESISATKSAGSLPEGNATSIQR